MKVQMLSVAAQSEAEAVVVSKIEMPGERALYQVIRCKLWHYRIKLITGAIVLWNLKDLLHHSRAALLPVPRIQPASPVSRCSCCGENTSQGYRLVTELLFHSANMFWHVFWLKS